MFSKSSLLTIESVRSFPLATLWWFAVKEQINTKVRIHFQKYFSSSNLFAKLLRPGRLAQARMPGSREPISELDFGGKMPRARHHRVQIFFPPDLAHFRLWEVVPVIVLNLFSICILYSERASFSLNKVRKTTFFLLILCWMLYLLPIFHYVFFFYFSVWKFQPWEVLLRSPDCTGM